MTRQRSTTPGQDERPAGRPLQANGSNGALPTNLPANHKATVKPRGRVVPDLSLWSQFTRIGGGLTPRQVSQIIREADTGSMARLMDLGNESRQKDCHLHSVLATSEEAVAGLKWELELPDDPTTQEKKACEQATVALTRVGMARLVAHHAGARFYGHAVTEVVWGRGERGLLFPVHFEHLAPRRFGYLQADGRFVWHDPFTGTGLGTEPQDLSSYPRGKFIISHPRVNGDVPCREGLIRVLVWAALFRNWAIGDWLKLGEIAWKPWRLGKFKRGASQEDIDELTAILEGLTTNGVGTHADDTEVEIMWGTASKGGGVGSTHSELVSMMAAEMSKAALGQTLTTEQGRVGSQALGNVQNEVRKDLREATVRYCSGDLNRDLIEPLWQMNWGPGCRASRFKMLTDDVKDLVQFSTAIKTFSDAGLPISTEWVRDEAGIQDPKDGDELLGGGVQGEQPEPAPAPPPPPPLDPEQPNDEPPAPADPPDDATKPTPAKPKAKR